MATICDKDSGKSVGCQFAYTGATEFPPERSLFQQNLPGAYLSPLVLVVKLA